MDDRGTGQFVSSLLVLHDLQNASWLRIRRNRAGLLAAMRIRAIDAEAGSFEALKVP